MASSARKLNISRLFPNLFHTVFVITSNPSAAYNCIAFAARDEKRFWWPDSERTNYWPPEVPREETLDAFIQAFQLLGYETCENGACEDGFEKIALFTKHGKPTHAARSEGRLYWKSKLGTIDDIQHVLEGIEGDRYGVVSAFLKRAFTPNVIESGSTRAILSSPTTPTAPSSTPLATT